VYCSQASDLLQCVGYTDADQHIMLIITKYFVHGDSIVSSADWRSHLKREIEKIKSDSQLVDRCELLIFLLASRYLSFSRERI